MSQFKQRLQTFLIPEAKGDLSMEEDPVRFLYGVIAEGRARR